VAIPALNRIQLTLKLTVALTLLTVTRGLPY